MKGASALVLLLRRDRADVAAVLLVTLLVAFTALVAAGGVRILQRTTDVALQDAVASAPVGQRTIRLSDVRATVNLGPTGSIADWHAEGERQRAAFPEPLGDLVGDANLAVGSMRVRVTNPPSFPLFVNLRYLDRIEDVAQLSAGRWPATTNQQLPPVAEFPQPGTGGGRPVATDHSDDPPRRFEIAVQESTARALGISVGSVYSINADLLDPLFIASALRTTQVRLAPAELEVTGFYRVLDPRSDAWMGDQRLAFDDLGAAMDQPIATISGFVAPDALPGLMSSGLPFEFQWRFPIRIDRLDADAVGITERGLRLFDAQAGGADAGSSVSAESGLLPLLERHRVLRSGTEAVLALSASAPLALAAGATAMAAVLLSRRRRSAMVLARGRGATPRLLLAASLVEAGAMAAAAAIVGVALAIALEPAADLGPAILAAGSIGIAAVVILVAAAWPQIRQPLAELEGSARGTRRTEMRRLVLELLVVILAVMGAYMLRQRGITSAATPVSGDAPPAAFDPFLAAVPALIALAVGIVALRLYRPAMAAIGWLADRRRDLVPVLAARTIARGAASGMPVLVLLLAVAFAAFTSVVSRSIDDAQLLSSWTAVGADVRIDPTGERRFMPTEAQIEAVPHVEAFASGFVDTRARAPSSTGVGTMALYAVQPEAYSQVVAGSPIEPGWPARFRERIDQVDDGRLPAILASRLTGGQLRLKVGDTFQVIIRGRALVLEIVEVRSAMPGLVSESSFVIIPYEHLRERMGDAVPPTVMWIRAAPEAISPLTDLLRPDTSGIRLQSRYDHYDTLRNQPLVGVVGAGFAVALGISIAYAVLTILGSVMLSASRRTRDAAILRTLGLDGGQQTRLTIFEHAPPIVMALPVGLALGIGVALAVAPAVDLGTLSGSRGSIPLSVDWVTLTVVSAALAAIALIAVIIGTWLSRRAAIINALRITSD